MISGASVICVGVLVQGMLKDGVSSWVPTLITEKYDVSASFSLLLSAIMPIINLSGAWIGTKLYEKVFKLNETAAAAFCFALTLIPLTGILFVGHYHIALCVIFFALFTTLITAINHLVITLIPVRFANTAAPRQSAEYSTPAHISAARYRPTASARCPKNSAGLRRLFSGSFSVRSASPCALYRCAATADSQTGAEIRNKTRHILTKIRISDKLCQKTAIGAKKLKLGIAKPGILCYYNVRSVRADKLAR